MKNAILTGIRSNSVLTLGNYLGALLPMVRLANEHSTDTPVHIFIPDLHSVISSIDGDLQQNILSTIKYWLAAGLVLNENIHIYRQSYVPAHSELCWLLDCVATMGETSRMIQYKEKSKNSDSANVGIFNYPILMAADILLYDAEFVPLGEDQFQHIELARNLAQRFNSRFGDIFTIPASTSDQVKFMHQEFATRIRDLREPEKKMSKSAPSESSKILLTDTPDSAKKKILSATTDSIGVIKFDFINQPGISNLLVIESLLSDRPLQDVISDWAGQTRYGDLKTKVASSVASFLEIIQSKVSEISDAEVLSILEKGEIYANEKANKKLSEVQRAFGLR